MAFLQLSSTNPNFSYILGKNPKSGMFIKPNRKGRLFAWYTNPGLFNIYFRDSDTEVSYSGEDFEYMDVTRYNTPLFLINAFSEFLKHMKNVDKNDVIGCDNVLMINQMRCKKSSLDNFETYFTDLGYEFKFDEVAFRNYRIEIKTKNTIRELVNLGQMLAIFNSLLNNDLEYISDNDIDKYINCLTVIDSPYYIRHLFKLYFLKTDKLFKKYKKILETNGKDTIEFEFGSTLIQRMSAIKKLLDFKNNIVDIGCGTGDYAKEFAPKLGPELMYYAIDNVPKRIESVKRLCERKKIENVVTWSSVDEFIVAVGNGNNGSNNIIGNDNNNVDVIMTEVVEHMTKEDATILINKVLDWKFGSIIITTPNKTFNINYQLFEDDKRHEEHIFEMTKEEFVEWISELVTKKIISTPNSFNVKFFEIGDNVNGLRPTTGVIIKRI